ncbi:MAG: DUF2130 domain-containing protein [Erysipelotrichaceae bacterium]|nr:DUF2130 domain-containing protein [Erysipelotrichaceae bacterium]
MNQIKCPRCGEVFQIDESSYDSIVRQVRDHEFNDELKRRELEYEQKIKSAVELAKARTENDSKEDISRLRQEITRLKTELENKDSESKLMVSEAVALKNKELMQLQASSQAMKESYETKLSDKDEQIAYYKDFKARQSTKMIGEDLEQHCLYEFNRVRPLFRNAYFEKDNDASEGSKGDFIFRDYDDDGTEIVSIMFEMKNEADETATKHKNEDFLDKLDKDRRNKNCEYAVLVSLLEMNSDLYNEGIVDMSHRYAKMYVVRPQNFISIITLLRNANLNSLDYKRQLTVAKNQDLDYQNFEANMISFKEAFGRNYELASRKFQDAIDDIDRTIKALEKTKNDLVSSERNLRLANDKAQDLSIKKLTKNAPSIAEKINGSK